MKLIDYKLNILGLKTKEGAIPISAFNQIVNALLKGSDRVLRLFVEGKSTGRGKSPDWLKKSLDFTITGIKTGSTTLEMEVPVLEDTIPEQFLQRKPGDARIKPGDTAISLLSKSIADAAAENAESNYFDAGVLDALLSFQTITKNYAKELKITSNTNVRDSFKISSTEIKKIKKIKIELPKPHTIVISGFFNLIEHNNRRFQLKTTDDKNVDGIMAPSFVNFESIRELWGKKVTIKGKAYYKASGELRHIEAQIIRPVEAGDEIFQRIPGTRKHFKFVEKSLIEKNPHKSLKKIWGKWPGNESINDLLSAL